eukprot:4639117-Pyramimonas_sp.AAC.1
MEGLRTALRREHCPPIALSSGGTSLSHKFLAVVYAMWLVSGKSMANLQRFLDDLSVGTTDFGTEFHLSTVLPVKAADLFPWMYHLEDDFDQGLQCDDGHDGDTPLSIRNSIGAPGLLHIIHNIGKDLASCCPDLDEAVDSLAAVARCLQHEFTQSR